MAKSRKLRWGPKDTAKIFALFEEGAIPTHLEGLTKEILLDVKNKHFHKCWKIQAFKETYKRKIEEFKKLKEKEEWNLEASNGFNLDNVNKYTVFFY